MGWSIGKSSDTPPPASDPRDKVGQNPTGRERKSSAGKRRQEAKKGK